MPESTSNADSSMESAQPSRGPQHEASAPAADSPKESNKKGEILIVPLGQILVVPEDNPRGPYPQKDIDDMVRSLKQSGQETPILLRYRTPEERAQAHTDKPYRLVGGFLRTAAAPLVPLTALEAIARHMTPQEAQQAAILDNVRKDMNWLAWAKAADSLIKSGMNQQQAADALAKDQTTISKALKLLKLLNKTSQGLIYDQFIKSDDYEITQGMVLVLADLATGSADDQGKIEAALRVVYDRQLTLNLVKKLVEWIKKGNSPESFPQDGKTEVKKGVKNQRFDPNDPLAKLWQDLPRTIQVRQTPKGYKAVLTLGKDEAALALFGALGTVEEAKRLQGQPHDPRYATALAGIVPGLVALKPAPVVAVKGGQGLKADLKLVWEGFEGAGVKAIFGKLAKNPWQALGQIFWKCIVTLWKVFCHILKWVYEEGKKVIKSEFNTIGRLLAKVFRPVVIWFLRVAAFLLVLWLIWTYLFHPGALIARLKGYIPTWNKTAQVAPKVEQAPQTTAVPILSEVIKKVEPKRPVRKISKHTAQAMATEKPTPIEAPAASTLSPRDQAGLQRKQLFVKNFANDVYGPSYHDIPTWLGNLKAEIADGYQVQFFYENYPPAKIQEIQDKKWVAYFKPTQPPQWVGTDGASDQFLIEGVVTTKSDLNYPGEVVSTQPISIKVWVHEGVQGPQVTRVEKVTVP